MGFLDQPVPSTGDPGSATPPASTEGTPAPPVTDAPATDTGPAPVVDKQYIDTSAMGSHLVKVTVDGAEVEMPLNDALQGVMRQQDYTRKTQEVADIRRRAGQAISLVDALEADPVGTLKQLANVYEIDPENGFQAAEPDPVQQQLRQQERAIYEMRQQAVSQQINAEVAALKQQYGEFDVRPVAEYAYNNGMRLTDAYKAMNFDSVRSQTPPAQTTAQQNRERALAAQTVEGGASTQRGAVTTAPKKISSFRDAWFAAKNEHGL